jgi:ERCC4-related helicase
VWHNFDVVQSPYSKLGLFRLAGALKAQGSFSTHRREDLVLANFRSGYYNTLFSTSIAEEGLDVQHCSLVICCALLCNSFAISVML